MDIIICTSCKGLGEKEQLFENEEILMQCNICNGYGRLLNKKYTLTSKLNERSKHLDKDRKIFEILNGNENEN